MGRQTNVSQAEGTLGLNTLLASSMIALFAAMTGCSGSEVGNGAGLCDPACADNEECIDSICVSKRAAPSIATALVIHTV